MPVLAVKQKLIDSVIEWHDYAYSSTVNGTAVCIGLLTCKRVSIGFSDILSIWKVEYCFAAGSRRKQAEYAGPGKESINLPIITICSCM